MTATEELEQMRAANAAIGFRPILIVMSPAFFARFSAEVGDATFSGPDGAESVPIEVNDDVPPKDGFTMYVTRGEP